MHVVRIWDLPTRLFHWLLAACVIGLVVTGNVGGNAMVWHFRLGYVVFGLLLFRFLWGFIGGHWSRFGTLVLSPVKVLRYLRGESAPADAAGHNPLGSLSVLALLLFLSAQVGTGLFSDDEIAAAGPLTGLVSGSVVSWATAYHKSVGKSVLIVLVLLHVVAILFYLWRRKENLIRPMISGDKALPTPVPPARDDGRSRLFAAALVAACSVVVVWVVRLGT